MPLLLTSCGLETDAIQAQFLKMLPRPAAEARALFIPTAAISPDAIEVLPKCLEDLYRCGIPPEHITVYDLHEPMSAAEAAAYDVIYLCGGRTAYLLSRIREQGFQDVLAAYLETDGVVLGVSAGSVIFAANLPDNLGALRCPLHVHAGEAQKIAPGRYPAAREELVSLGNRQAIYWDGDEIVILE